MGKIIQKAVILVAGKSTRTFPLTATRPKALLKVGNKPILLHTIDALKGLVKEIILVVNYKQDMIKGLVEKKKNITFIEQKQLKGTGHAVLQAEPAVGKGKFLILVGDDMFSKKDIEKLIKYDAGILAQRVENPTQYGVLGVEKNKLVGIKEKPKRPKNDLVNIGCYLVDDSLFSILKKCKKSKRGEYELTDAVVKFAKQKPMQVVKAAKWQPITYAWQLLDANKEYLKGIKFKNQGKIERGVTIQGNVQVGKGTLIRSGAYLQGPIIIGKDCKIGPNCYIRASTSLGDGVKVGNAVEIKNCVIDDNSSIGHLSYIGDSVIGTNVNCGAGTITANLRHDNANVKSEIKKKVIDTGRRKLGTILGDNVHTGIHTAIYPGRKLWPGKSTLPGEAVKKDKK